MSQPERRTEFHDLLRRARKGSRDALGELFDACRPWLVSVADKALPAILRPKASSSDLIQETFLEFQRVFDRFKGDGPDELRAWLQAVLAQKAAELRRHYLATEKRRVGRERAIGVEDSTDSSTDGLAEAGRSPSSAARHSERSDVVLRAVARLPEHYRDVIRLRTWDGLPFAEVGRRLGRTEDAARMLWARAIEHLEQMLPTDV